MECGTRECPEVIGWATRRGRAGRNRCGPLPHYYLVTPPPPLASWVFIELTQKTAYRDDSTPVIGKVLIRNKLGEMPVGSR